jgi:hypothetical protein
VYSSLRGRQRRRSGGCKQFSLPKDTINVWDSNIWSPNRQSDIIELLGKHYAFSPRLLAIIKEIPPDRTPDFQDRNARKYKTLRKDDVETAASSIDSPRARAFAPSQSRQTVRQYDVAKQWINLQSIDVGQRCESGSYLGA